MRLLRFCAIFVTLLGVAAMAIVVMPALSSRARAQGRIYAERPYDAGQSQRDDRPERRGRALTLLGGRGSGLGVRITDRTEGGVVIDEVVDDSPAEKAGLKRSDVIVEFDGERVRSARQFSRLVQETPSGRTVKLTITRDGKRQDLQVTPDERRGDAMVSGDFGDYMRDLGRDLGQFGDRLAPFNFNFDFGMPMLSGRRLGVTVDPLTSQLAEYFGVKDGLLVTSVAEGSAAARAGLKAGDVITSVDGERVASREDLMRGLRDASSEDVKIGIMRDKKESSVTAKIEAPARRTPRGRPA
jgi:S1-C subfamily serine protease